MALTDDMLVREAAYPGGLGGVQRIYALPNGYGLSAVNSPMLHSYPFAWEIAVVEGLKPNGQWDRLTYETPLTDNVEVFDSDAEANEFIARAKAWAEAAN